MNFDQERDKYSEVMTIEDFVQCAVGGVFIPDDGVGYFGSETNYSRDACVWGWDGKRPEGATHVHWYNK